MPGPALSIRAQQGGPGVGARSGRAPGTVETRAADVDKVTSPAASVYQDVTYSGPPWA